MVSILTGNKFDPNTDIPDLSGKQYIVVGGTAGIGFGITAHILQHKPAKLYFLSKKPEHGDEAQKELERYGDISKVEYMKCELEDLKQVNEVAQELKKLERLDGLICNAGLGVGPYGESADGIESHMQVNHISQFHLIRTLLPILQKTPNSRLVIQSSDLHKFASSSVKFTSLSELNEDIGATLLYNRSKLANALLILALSRRFEKNELGFDSTKKNGPWINATHPGGVSTDQQEQAVDAYGTLGKIGVAVVRPFMKDPIDQGCRPALFAATSEDIVKDGIQGRYIVPDRKVDEFSNQAKDVELGESLWKLTEELLEKKLGKLSYES